MSCPVGGPCIYYGCARWGCGKMRPKNIDFSKVPDEVEVSVVPGDDAEYDLDFAVNPEYKP